MVIIVIKITILNDDGSLQRELETTGLAVYERNCSNFKNLAGFQFVGSKFSWKFEMEVKISDTLEGEVVSGKLLLECGDKNDLISAMAVVSQGDSFFFLSPEITPPIIAGKKAMYADW